MALTKAQMQDALPLINSVTGSRDLTRVLEDLTGALNALDAADTVAAGTQQTHVADPADITENSTDLGGTQDGDFDTLTLGWNGSAAATAAEATLLIDAIRECAAGVNAANAKINSILASLEEFGIHAAS